jgi:hypothetical protein
MTLKSNKELTIGQTVILTKNINSNGTRGKKNEEGVVEVIPSYEDQSLTIKLNSGSYLGVYIHEIKSK